MDWIVEVRSPDDASGNNRIQLGLKNGQNEEIVWVTAECGSLADWKQKVQELQDGLLKALHRGEEYWQNQQELGSSTQAAGQEASPEDVWEKMQEFEDEQQMSAYFNQLGHRIRKMTAEYILSQVSMFKGKAPYFAQNYDFDSNTLG